MPKSASSSKESSKINTHKLSQLLEERFGVHCIPSALEHILEESKLLDSPSHPQRAVSSYIAIKDIVAVVRQQLGLKRSMTVSMDMGLEHDLGADDLDVLEIVMACEETFNVPLPEHEETIQHVSDLVASVRFGQFLQKHAETTCSKNQLELMRSLISASLQCPPGTWMDYSAKKRTMQALAKKGWVRMSDVQGDSYTVKVCDHELIAR